jgi:hypothetical protein
MARVRVLVDRFRWRDGLTMHLAERGDVVDVPPAGRDRGVALDALADTTHPVTRPVTFDYDDAGADPIGDRFRALEHEVHAIRDRAATEATNSLATPQSIGRAVAG